MKKTYIITMCLMMVLGFFNGAAFAGTGVKVGVNVSGLNFGDNDYRSILGHEIWWLFTNNITGFQAGLYHTICLSKHLSLQPELLFTARGMSADTEFLYEDIGYKVRLNYIEVPLLLKVIFPMRGLITPGLLFGPYCAFKISAQKNVDVGRTNESTDLDNVKSFDYGVMVGGFLEFKLGKGNLSLEFRYNHGLANVMTVHDDFVPLYGEKTGSKIKNFSAAVMVGLRF